MYGSVAEGASRETDELRPRNPYSASKAGADRLAYSYWATYGVPVVITRASNNYGPNQFPEKVIPLFITNASTLPVPLYGDGLNVRDWLHVDDHCRAIDSLIEPGRRRGLQHRRRQRRQERRPDAPHPRAARTTGVADPSRRRSSRPRPPLLARHHQAATRSAGSPAVPFEQGLADTVEWYRQNEWWWRPIKERRRGVPGVLRDAVRRPPGLRSALSAGLPLVTGATGFAGSHLSIGSLEREPAIAAWSNAPAARPSAPQSEVTVATPSTCWIATAWRRAIAELQPSRDLSLRRRRRRRHVVGRRASRTSQVNVLGTHHLLEAVRRAGLDCRVLVVASAQIYRASATTRSPRTAPHRPAEPVRRQQARAGDARAARGVEDGSDVVVARPFNHAGPRQIAGVRHVELRAADRARSKPGARRR